MRTPSTPHSRTAASAVPRSMYGGGTAGARAAAVAPPVSRTSQCADDAALLWLHRSDGRAALECGGRQSRPLRGEGAARQRRDADLTRTPVSDFVGLGERLTSFLLTALAPFSV